MAKTMNLKTCLILAVIWAMPSFAFAGKIIYVNPDVNGGITIDHNCVDLSIIPDSYLPSAASLRALFRHASVGDGINWGLDCLAGLKPTNSSCSCYTPGKYDRSNWILENRGNPGSKEKIDDLVTQTQLRSADFDVLMMKFCYIDALGDSHPDWDYYRTKMEQLEADYPNKKFVWWTIPLTRDGMPGTDWFNQKVRSYCAEHKKILFDIADIECYDPNGVKQTNAQGCEVICQDYTNEIHAGHLNVRGRIRVASAFWHLMARIAGWQRGPIQKAIDAASDGDTIIVENGTYFENINFRGKNIVLTSTNSNDPCIVAETIIDGNNLGSVVTFVGTENSTCVLSGFTIQNGFYDFEYTRGGGGISGGSETNHTHATIVSNIIAYNFAWDGGGLSRCDGLVKKNIIINNYARWHEGGGGLYLCNGFIRNNIIAGNVGGGCEGGGGLSYCDGIIQNNTITKNISQRGDFGGGLIFCHGIIRNNIIWENSPEEIPWWIATTSFNCFQGWGSGSNGNIDTDPCFADPNNGDYHLKSQAGRWDANSASWIKDGVTSPCIDAGDPTSPIGLEPFPNGGRINMGAYGGTAEASKSYFGEPVCETIVAGDINGDCKIDTTDLWLMTSHWLEEH